MLVMIGKRLAVRHTHRQHDNGQRQDASRDPHETVVVEGQEGPPIIRTVVCRQTWNWTEGSATRFAGIASTLLANHSEKRRLFELLEAGAAGLGLTESFAMTPAAAVSGLYFGHPGARYFAVGRIGRDQVVDYAERKGVGRGEVERWLRPNLAYEPDDN